MFVKSCDERSPDPISAMSKRCVRALGYRGGCTFRIGRDHTDGDVIAGLPQVVGCPGYSNRQSCSVLSGKVWEAAAAGPKEPLSVQG